MIKSIYRKAFRILGQKPFHLWGLSLLSVFLIGVAGVGLAAVPIAGLVVGLVLNAGMTMVYLAGYRGEGIETENLFEGFKKGKFVRVAAGMAWMNLWIVLWGLIPVVGIVFAIIKAYQFRFVPYILMTRPDVKILDAVKISRKETMGYKGQMFGAEFLFGILVAAGLLILFLLSLIPIVGILFNVILVIAVILVIMFAPLFLGLVQAAFYDEIQNRLNAPAEPVTEPANETVAEPVAETTTEATVETGAETVVGSTGETVTEASEEPAAPAEPAQEIVCPACGKVLAAGTSFCTNCGLKLR